MSEPTEKKARGLEWTPIVPVPPDCPAPPPQSHRYRDAPRARWLYHDRDGQALGWVYEFLDSKGKPVRDTCLWAKNPRDERAWRFGVSFPEPRPLYGLMDLAGERALDEVAIPVLLLPTEAEADRARAALVDVALSPDGLARADIPCLSWPGGVYVADKADWSALAGWPVVIWPEYSRKRKSLSKVDKEAGVDPESRPFLKAKDQPGWRAAGKIAEALTGADCEVHVLNLPEVGAEPAGWGIGTIIDQGITGSALWEWIRLRMDRFSPARSGTDKPLSAPAREVRAEAAPPPIPPHTPSSASAEGGGPADGEDWSWRERIIYKDERPVECRENVKLFLSYHPALRDVVWEDEFAHQIVMRHPAPWVNPEGFKPREWREADSYELGAWLVEKDRLLVKGEGVLAAAVSWAADSRKYHPVREYLDGLVWDGTPRLGEWLSDYMGVEKSEYSQIMGRMFLVSMVARIYRPGCLVRTMPIFEGTQGRGKSSSARVLGGQWFSDTVLDLDSKDSLQNIQGTWLYEWPELDTLGRADIRRVKAYISSSTDRFRPPYGRNPIDYPRQTVFIGSVNQFNDYLRDPSGSTRFWPVHTGAVDDIKLEALADARDQLFAEAVRAYQAGENWWPTSEQQNTIFEPQQADREVSDVWEEIISDWLENNPVLVTTAKKILIDALKVDPAKIPSNGGMETRVGLVMSRLGWAKRREMKEGIRKWYYIAPKRSGESHGNAGPF